MSKYSSDWRCMVGVRIISMHALLPSKITNETAREECATHFKH